MTDEEREIVLLFRSRIRFPAYITDEKIIEVQRRTHGGVEEWRKRKARHAFFAKKVKPE